jgi:acyl-CoA thioesterase
VGRAIKIAFRMDIDAIKHLFTKDRFAALAGVELVSLAPGRAIACMTVGPQHLNSMGVLHGAAIFTLADFAFAAAVNSHGTVALAINVSISFFKAVNAGKLTATAREISLNNKLGNYTIDITDEQGQSIALFQGLAYRKKDPLPLNSP